jgi:hypothetical protein
VGVVCIGRYCNNHNETININHSTWTHITILKYLHCIDFFVLINVYYKTKPMSTQYLLNMFAVIYQRRPPLWSSGWVSGYRSRGPGSISGAIRFLLEVVGLKRGPLDLVSTIEELLRRKSIGSALENREYCRTDPSRWPRGALYPQKWALTSPSSGSRSVGIVRSRTQATKFYFISAYPCECYDGILKWVPSISSPVLCSTREIRDTWWYWFWQLALLSTRHPSVLHFRVITVV